MRFVAILIRRLIKNWLWFFFPVMALFLAGLFYGWGVNWATALAAVFIVMMMLLAAFLAWFWLAFFKAVADGAQAQPGAEVSTRTVADVHKPAP